MSDDASQPSARRMRRTPSSIDEPTIVVGDNAHHRHSELDQGDGSPYLVHEIIGQGGLSLVHRGWQRSLEREVAIKIARGDRLLAHQAAGSALCAEARIAAQLDHPGVLPMHDLQWLDQDTPMLIMRRIHGDTWAQRSKDLSRQEHASILMQVAQVIRYAHAQGIIHRDLKPANVLLGAYGEVIVIDWGMALHRSDYADSSQPWPGGVSGTPQYMAPEAARELRPSPSLDIYGLGAMLFKALCGIAPHPFEDVAEAMAHARAGYIADHPDPQSDDLLQVALRALATDPDQRYASADAFCEALAEAISHEEARRLILEAEADTAAAQQSPQSYRDYQRAIFRYQEALQLWPNNRAIDVALENVRETYAACALKHGDLDLAASILQEGAGLSPDLSQRIRTAQEERARAQQETQRIHQRTLWMQSFLLDVLTQAGYNQQGPDVTLMQALRHCSDNLRDRHHSRPEDRIDVRLAVLQSINEPHLVDIRQVLINDIDQDLQRIDQEVLAKDRYCELIHARAGVLIDQGRYSAALPLAEEFWNYIVNEGGSDDIATLTIAYDMLVTCLLNSGDSRASAAMLTEYLQMVERSSEHLSPEYRRSCRVNIFGCMLRCGELDQAETLGKTLLEEAVVPLSDDRHTLLMNMIFLYLDQGRWLEASEHITEVYHWRCQRFGAEATPSLHIAIMRAYVHGLLGEPAALDQAREAYALLRARPDSTPLKCLEPLCRVARLQQIAQQYTAAAATLERIFKDIAQDHVSEDRLWLHFLAELVQARQYASDQLPDQALATVLVAAEGLDQHFGAYDGRARRARVLLAELSAWAQEHYPQSWDAWRHTCSPQQCALLAQGESDRSRFPGLTVA
ncbi:MAG: serine/threonine protein kinase [Planctomycetota bacterium]|nr:MAG: serine/threonine protein kinase [Planctomycetota bacterium]